MDGWLNWPTGQRPRAHTFNYRLKMSTKRWKNDHNKINTITETQSNYRDAQNDHKETQSNYRQTQLQKCSKHLLTRNNCKNTKTIKTWHKTTAKTLKMTTMTQNHREMRNVFKETQNNNKQAKQLENWFCSNEGEVVGPFVILCPGALCLIISPWVGWW